MLCDTQVLVAGLAVEEDDISLSETGLEMWEGGGGGDGGMKERERLVPMF